MKKAIVLAGSRGLGKAVAVALKDLKYTVIATSRRELDTWKIAEVETFIEQEKDTDVLVLNTGGPPAKDFSEITRADWDQYYHQLF